jgi:hypothetical protein
MFARQWFRPGSQAALEEPGLNFEKLLRNRNYSKALDLVNSQLNTSGKSDINSFWPRQLSRTQRLQNRCACGKNNFITIAFIGFWDGFKQDENEILNLLNHAAEITGLEIKVVNSDPDILIFSCFGNPSLKEFKAATRLLYLGENVRPDFSEADYSLTFDFSDYCGRNIYLPLWLLRSTTYASKNANYQPFVPKELEKPRIANQGQDCIVYIGNNSTPTRLEAINELKNLGFAVQCYGSQTNPVDDKIKTLKQYKYTLCLENTFTPGYVTEKIIDSYLAGSIPIYWGGAPPSEFNFNDCFICDPYVTMAQNMQVFANWKQNRNLSAKVLSPLLKAGAIKRTETLVLKGLAQIFLDLF